ncbi:MAG TPA: metalloregulator ArsR/SmtB family transcription factor [Candidatus Thermoplasmatota archaeon]|nr:metalloregulator ArsR/SmtB family transcription factor [Candidatus Thermoplasmatota archaeon]
MSDALTLTFHALADPTRRRILARLAKGEATVQELTDPLPISQPAVSKHLNVLEQAGLVVRRQQTPRRYAQLRGEPIQSAITYLTEFQRRWDEDFARLDDLLEEEGSKKARRR